MTHPIPSADIASEIAALRSDLAKVEAAIPVMGKAASAKAKEIAAAIDDAQERYAAALADEVTAARDARLASFTDISVTYPDDPERNLLRMNFTISYTKRAYDPVTKTTVPKVTKVDGFRRLPDDAMEYLLTCPEVIPDRIMALAPGDPVAALSRYFLAVKRGYVRAEAA